MRGRQIPATGIICRHALIEMPRACPVVAHVCSYSPIGTSGQDATGLSSGGPRCELNSNKHEAPRGKRVVSQKKPSNSERSGTRETPRDKPVASFDF
jgi:hypothetical protein